MSIEEITFPALTFGRKVSFPSPEGGEQVYVLYYAAELSECSHRTLVLGGREGMLIVDAQGRSWRSTGCAGFAGLDGAGDGWSGCCRTD